MRHNLWIVSPEGSRVLCHGSRSEMNDIAILAGIPGEVHVLPDGEEPNCPTTLKPVSTLTLQFDSLPPLEALQHELRSLTAPFSVEITQGVVHGPGGLTVDQYHELIDCETVEDLYDFLHHSEYGPADKPLTIEIEEVELEPAETWNDHPSLTPSERN